jgi:citrate synthase
MHTLERINQIALTVQVERNLAWLIHEINHTDARNEMTSVANVPDGLMPAGEVVKRLGISHRTLYAYVSRGLIRSVPSSDKTRTRYYRTVDVENLMRRRDHTRGPTAAAATALYLGLPILETRITRIIDGRIIYRGHDAVALAETEDLERVAQILWEVESEDPFDGPAFNPWLDARWSRAGRAVECLSPAERAMALLPLVTARPGGLGPTTSPRSLGNLLIALANAIVGRPLEPGIALHQAIAQAWGRLEAADAIRRALVLCADHELASSTFAVRVAASTGAPPLIAVHAGLAAIISSPFDGVEPSAATTQSEPLRHEKNDPAVRGELSGVPLGVDHPLHPDGDPRALAVIRHLDRMPQASKLLRRVEQMYGPKPNLVMALWALEQVHGLPNHSGIALFAIGRSVGWIAHALEQRSSSEVIRPRAKFVGIE